MRRTAGPASSCHYGMHGRQDLRASNPVYEVSYPIGGGYCAEQCTVQGAGVTCSKQPCGTVLRGDSRVSGDDDMDNREVERDRVQGVITPGESQGASRAEPKERLPR
jgi:hypothetical protein